MDEIPLSDTKRTYFEISTVERSNPDPTILQLINQSHSQETTYPDVQGALKSSHRSLLFYLCPHRQWPHLKPIPLHIGQLHLYTTQNPRIFKNLSKIWLFLLLHITMCDLWYHIKVLTPALQACGDMPVNNQARRLTLWDFSFLQSPLKMCQDHHLPHHRKQRNLNFQF